MIPTYSALPDSPIHATVVSTITVLVVDDVRTMRQVVVNQLRYLGIQHILEAGHGAEALQILEKTPVSLIISDVNMPVMNGLDLLFAIRKNPRLFVLPIIMMVTSDTGREHLIQAAYAGVSDLLVKPYSPHQFADRVEKALKRKPPFSAPIDPSSIMAAAKTAIHRTPPSTSESALTAKHINTTPSENTHQKHRLLIVDDIPTNLMLMGRLFKEDYSVKIAPNGLKALEICHSAEPPDLILLDIMMPDMDGFEVAHRLHNDPETENIPVIFVTAMTDEETRLKGMELGAVDFFTKPVDPDHLKLSIKNFLRVIAAQKRLQTDYDCIRDIGITEDQKPSQPLETNAEPPAFLTSTEQPTNNTQQDIQNTSTKTDIEPARYISSTPIPPTLESLSSQIDSLAEQITLHDIKGHIGTLLSLAEEFTQSRNLSPQQHQKARLMKEVAEEALEIIGAAAKVYQIEMGLHVCKAESVMLGIILLNQIEAAKQLHVEKSLKFHIDVFPEGQTIEQLNVQGESALLRSAFSNVLKNACEAAPAETIIFLRINLDHPNYVEIENRGLVPKELRVRFFDKGVTHGKTGGQGLGTYSTRRLIEAQGGKISLSCNDIGQTTTIRITMPAWALYNKPKF